jgi:hypothetical protein
MLMNQRCIGTGAFLMVWAMASSAFAGGRGNGHGNDAGFGGIIIFLGVMTFAFLLTTFILGIFMPKNRKALFPWHKRLGYITLISALAHGTMVFLYH